MTPRQLDGADRQEGLDFSGGVSAEDNFGIGGYERIMGPNGQAQYWAADLAAACRVLLATTSTRYVAPGERFRAGRTDRSDLTRDVGALAARRARDRPLTPIARSSPTSTNPERKQPFDIRSVMRAVIDADRPLERWRDARRRERGRVGRAPRRLAGRRSGSSLVRCCVERRSAADGPDNGHRARCSRARRRRSPARSTRPRAPAGGGARHLAGFDGSPESLRDWQLEFGAEIGRAVVNFEDRSCSACVSRYHGGAFVVFSQTLQPGVRDARTRGARAR